MAKVVVMNFFLYLWRYLLPRVRTPRTRLARPMAIPPYTSVSDIVDYLFNKKIIAADGAETFTSLEPWARASRHVLAMRGTTNSLSTKIKGYRFRITHTFLLSLWLVVALFYSKHLCRPIFETCGYVQFVSCTPCGQPVVKSHASRPPASPCSGCVPHM